MVDEEIQEKQGDSHWPLIRNFEVECRLMETPVLRMEQQQNHSFHDDIVLEILPRLPVKSLLRCMWVCRHWNSLITSYSFRKLHRQIHYSSPPLFLTCHSAPNYDSGGQVGVLATFDLYGKLVQQWALPESFSPLIPMNIPYQSKLVCFKEHQTKRFFACNPSTRHIFPLPNCSSLKKYFYEFSVLGYILSNDKYLMMHLHLVGDEWVCEILTFSISDDNFMLHGNEWRSIKVTTMLNSVKQDSGVFAGGAFYYVATDENYVTCILSFDIETESFSTFGFPQGIPGWYSEFLELNDELYIMYAPDEPPTLALWKLSSDVNNNKLWTLHWNMDLTSLGYISQSPRLIEFDWRILIYRLEYLLGYIQPSEVVQGMGRLELYEHEEYMPSWSVNIHTNLFTL